MGACAKREKVVKEEKFLHTRTPPHRWGQGGVWNLRKQCKGGGSEGKTEKIRHRNHCQISFLSQEMNHKLPSGAMVGARCWGSGAGVRSQGAVRSGLPWGYSEGATSTQWRESREKTECPRVARSHCCRDTNGTLADSSWLPTGASQNQQNQSATVKLEWIKNSCPEGIIPPML